MTKAGIATMIGLLLCLSGCANNSLVLNGSESLQTSNTPVTTTAVTESTEKQEATITPSAEIDETQTKNRGSETPSDVETSDTNQAELPQGESLKNKESAVSSGKQSKANDPTEPAKPQAPKQTEPQLEPERPHPTEQPPSTQPTNPPVATEAPVPTALPSQPAPTEPPVPTEAPAPSPVDTNPPVETQPKSAYDYEFDINTIRADCIAIGQSMGYTLNPTMTPQNATWWNPIIASGSNQGDMLRSSLERYIRSHTVEALAPYGLDEISEFNICCESIGSGSYAIYFVFA